MSPPKLNKIFLYVFLMFIFLPFATPLSFNFPKFNDTIEDFLNFQHDAFFNKQVVWLTKNDLTTSIKFSDGRVVYKEKLLLWDSKSGNMTDFSTHFSFTINTLNNTDSGDGLTFFLLSNSSIFPDDLAGSSLGLYTNMTAYNTSIYSFAAVEVDTWFGGMDPPYDHLGINIDTYASVTTVPLNNTFDLYDRIVNAWIRYDSSTKNLSISLTNDIEQSVSLWHEVDLRKILPEEVDIGFSASTGAAVEMHKILLWEFSSNLAGPESPVVPRKMRKPGLIIYVGFVVVIGAVVVSSAFICSFFWRKRAKSPATQEDKPESLAEKEDKSIDKELEKEKGPNKISYDELFNATNGFDEERKLGRGGFGVVYIGQLNGENVAIKKVSAESEQGKKEYISEVTIINRLRHLNLVPLVGWCHKQGEFLLVYKYMPNKSLDYHLYSQAKILVWHVRHKISLGIATALSYLHEQGEQCVLHRDIKPSNVMLDSDFEAKLGDFGLSRLVDHQRGAKTTRLGGTIPYLAPECYTTGKATKESDIYSYGVVALEIACGRRPFEDMEEPSKRELMRWVRELYERGMILDAADNRLNLNSEQKNQMERLMVAGLWCVHPDPVLRPSIGQAISILNFSSPLTEIPPVTLPYILPILFDEASSDLNNNTY